LHATTTARLSGSARRCRHENHGCRYEQAAHDRGVENHCDRDADAELLDGRVAVTDDATTTCEAGDRNRRHESRSPPLPTQLHQRLAVRQHDGVGERTLEIAFLEPGAEAYAFTFG
jgi:hypothetical protein